MENKVQLIGTSLLAIATAVGGMVGQYVVMTRPAQELSAANRDNSWRCSDQLKLVTIERSEWRDRYLALLDEVDR